MFQDNPSLITFTQDKQLMLQEAIHSLQSWPDSSKSYAKVIRHCEDKRNIHNIIGFLTCNKAIVLSCSITHL